MLDRTGFRRKNYAELQEEINERAKELFGEDVNLSERSPLGIFIRLISWFLSKMYELAEKVYNSGFITKAEGVQLDRLTAFFNTSRNPEQFATVELTFIGTPNAVIPEGRRFETESGIDFAMTENVTLDSGGLGAGTAVCLTAGVVGNVPDSTITIQSEPSADLSDVTNIMGATGGREVETDAELLKRLQGSGANTGSGTPDAIVSEILAVQGVRAANIVINSESTTVNGIPPHSNAVYVLGGDPQDIANTLFKHYVGLQFYGSAFYYVNDISGNSHKIGFTPATSVAVYIDVEVDTDSTFRADGPTQIKDAIVKIIGGTASDGTIYVGLNMGQDVIYSKILAAVIGIQGVNDAVVTLGKEELNKTAANVVIANSEVAQTSYQNVTVTS